MKYTILVSGIALSASLLSAHAQGVATATATGVPTQATTTHVMHTMASTSPKTDARMLVNMCVGKAIDVRDTALEGAHDALSAKTKAAISARKVALVAAYNASTTQATKTMRAAAHAAFKASTQSAHNDMRTARQAAWKSFDAAAKACGAKGKIEAPQIIASPAVTY